MFFQLLYIHLYRPFLRYNRTTSPLPSHVSPRKFCTQAAGAISKLFRLYKRTHGLRQICNIAIYIAHTACTIHILNLPDKNAKRDITHGVKHLEEMGECWTAARRTLRILNLCAERWKTELPEEAEAVFVRGKLKWGMSVSSSSPSSPGSLTAFKGQLSQQPSQQPMPEMMAQNTQRSQTLRQTFGQRTSSGDVNTSLTQVQTGLSAGMAPSPVDLIDTRRSSGNLSMPPQSAADLIRNTGKIRPSTTLTKAQQDAWNAHQVRMFSMAASGAVSTKSDANAAKLFGGIDSLMEESQDWWYKDQSQLALGFDNWNAPTQDWFGFDVNFNNKYNDSNLDMIDSSGFQYPNGNANMTSGCEQLGNDLRKKRVNGNGIMMNGNERRYQPQAQGLNLDDEMFY